jgi:hypothetical protein
MTTRVVLGKRGSAYGLWVSPAGVDAMSAADSLLRFHMNTALEQLAMIGYATAGQVVALNFGVQPHVLLLGTYNGVAVHRPFPNAALFLGANGSVTVTPTTATFGYETGFAVLKRQIT